MVQQGNKLKNGRRVGNWLIVSDRFQISSTYFFKCECVCGVIRNVREWHLKHHKTLGCGCTNVIGRFRYKGCGDLSLSYYNSFKKNRIKKKFKFDDDVTINYLWNLFLIQNKKCALSNVDLYMDSHWTRKKSGSLKQTASIDRIDNSKGYSIGNIQWVHKVVNLMKGSLSEFEFITFCNNITKHKEIIYV